MTTKNAPLPRNLTGAARGDAGSLRGHTSACGYGEHSSSSQEEEQEMQRAPTTRAFAPVHMRTPGLDDMYAANAALRLALGIETSGATMRLSSSEDDDPYAFRGDVSQRKDTPKTK